MSDLRGKLIFLNQQNYFFFNKINLHIKINFTKKIILSYLVEINLQIKSTLVIITIIIFNELGFIIF